MAAHPHLAGYLRAQISNLVAYMLQQEQNGVIEDALVKAVATAFRQQVAERDD